MIELLRNVAAIVGSLVGVWLGYFLSLRRETRTRRAEYAQEALRRCRGFADQMEIAARDILWLLVGFTIGLPKDQRNQIRRNLSQINSRLTAEPWLPEVSDRNVEKAWIDVGAAFGEMVVTFASTNWLLSSRKAPQTPSKETLEELRKAFHEGQFDLFSSFVADNPNKKAVLETAANLIRSVRALRQEIGRASIGA